MGTFKSRVWESKIDVQQDSVCEDWIGTPHYYNVGATGYVDLELPREVYDAAAEGGNEIDEVSDILRQEALNWGAHDLELHWIPSIRHDNGDTVISRWALDPKKTCAKL